MTAKKIQELFNEARKTDKHITLVSFTKGFRAAEKSLIKLRKEEKMFFSRRYLELIMNHPKLQEHLPHLHNEIKQFLENNI